MKGEEKKGRKEGAFQGEGGRDRAEVQGFFASPHETNAITGRGGREAAMSDSETLMIRHSRGRKGRPSSLVVCAKTGAAGRKEQQGSSFLASPSFPSSTRLRRKWQGRRSRSWSWIRARRHFYVLSLFLSFYIVIIRLAESWTKNYRESSDDAERRKGGGGTKTKVL